MIIKLVSCRTNRIFPGTVKVRLTFTIPSASLILPISAVKSGRALAARLNASYTSYDTHCFVENLLLPPLDSLASITLFARVSSNWCCVSCIVAFFCEVILYFGFKRFAFVAPLHLVCFSRRLSDKHQSNKPALSVHIRTRPGNKRTF